MKIAFVTKSKLNEKRGLAFAIVAKCLAYSQVKVDTTLIFPGNNVKGEGNSNFNFWKYFQVPTNSFALVCRQYIDLPRNSLLEFVVVHFRYFIFSWTYSYQVYRYLFKNRFDVVHCYSECLELILIIKMLRFLYDPKVVCEVHYKTESNYVKLFELLVFRSLTLVLTTTISMRQYCIKKGLDPKHVRVFPEGVSLSDFDYKTRPSILKTRLSLPHNAKIIGYAGRFETNGVEKGIPTLIQSLKVLKRSKFKILLVCVGGPGYLIDKYRKMADELGVGAMVKLIDHVPPKTLYQYIRVFDICALPFPWTDHFAYNMSPLKMFEYMASKKPIIGTNLPSVKEILHHQVNALLVGPDDYIRFAKSVQLLLSNKKIYQRLSMKAFEDVSENYTWKKRAIKIVDLLNQ